MRVRTRPDDLPPRGTGVPPDEGLRWERLLSGIASSFIAAPLARYDEVVVEALRRIVLALDLDRSTLSYADAELAQLHPTHFWARPGMPSTPLGRTSMAFPWSAMRLRKGLPVVFSRLSDLPPEAAVDAAGFATLGLRSHVTLPIHVTQDFIGILSFGVLQQERDWPAPVLARMRLLADIFGSLLARKRAQDRIDELVRLEGQLVAVSTSLVAVGPELADAELHRAMEAVGSFLRVDRLRIYRTDPDSPGLLILRQWEAPGRQNCALMSADDERQAIRDVLSGRVVRGGADANLDLAGLLAIPLFGGGRVVGALSLARTDDAAADWPDELLPRLEMFGNMLAGAIARRDAEEAARRATHEASEYREHLAHLARVDAVGAMSAAIAHEVNQPLAAIRNYALAAQRRLSGERRVDRARLVALMEKIAGQAGAAGDVLERIRAIVKRRQPRQMPIRVAALFANALSLIELTARRERVRVHTQLAPRLPPVLGDEVQVQQVIMNLAYNAVEAMTGVPDDKRVLRLAACAIDGDRIRIDISDTGPGISAEEAGRIFEPFYTTRGGGLGIGLPICRAIVESHGGELWHEPRQGGGSVFRFTLPVARQGG